MPERASRRAPRHRYDVMAAGTGSGGAGETGQSLAPESRYAIHFNRSRQMQVPRSKTAMLQKRRRRLSAELRDSSFINRSFQNPNLQKNFAINSREVRG